MRARPVAISAPTLLMVAACSSLLGLQAPREQSDGGGGGGGGDGGGNSDFSLTVTNPAPRVPSNGFDFLDISITRDSGDGSDVTVTLASPPAGVTAKTLVIPAGATTGQLEVDGAMSLKPGTTVMLDVSATSGAFTHDAMVTAAVTIPPGALDPSFGSGGIASSGPTQRGRTLIDVSVGSDGTITAVGTENSELAGDVGLVVQFTGSGAPDLTFGDGNGETTVNARNSAIGAFLQGMSRHQPALYLAGQGASTSGQEDGWVCRLTGSGAFDTGYGSASGANGVVHDIGHAGSIALAVTNTVDGVIALLVDPSSNAYIYRTLENGHDDFSNLEPLAVPVLVNGGHAAMVVDQKAATLPIYIVGDTPDRKSIAVARVTETGTLDPGFGGGSAGSGIAAIPKTADESAVAVTPIANGVLIAGTVSGTFFVRKLHEDGSVDTTFGTNGVVATPVTAAGAASVVDMVVQADGKILVAGNGAADSSAPGPILARYTADGAVDVTYGMHGVAAFALGNGVTIGGVDLQQDGKAIVAGGLQDSNGASVLARVGF